MIDLDVAAEDDGRLTATFSADEWELNVRGTSDEFAVLVRVEEASWDDRSSIRAGTCAGSPVFWASTVDGIVILVGEDDELWDVSVSMDRAKLLVSTAGRTPDAGDTPSTSWATTMSTDHAL